jgi:HEAT repeat protein
MNLRTALLALTLGLATVGRADEPSFAGKTATAWGAEVQRRGHEAFDGLAAPEARPVTLALLRHADARVRVATLMFFWRTGPRDLDVFTAVLELRHDDDAEVRADALLTLAAHGAPALDALVEGLSDRDGSVRTVAARGVGQLGRAGAPALERLLALLVDEDRSARSQAARALIGVGATVEQAGPSLLARFQAEDDLGVRGDVAAALGELGVKAAIPVLRQALQAGEPALSMSAAASLVQLGERDALERLLIGGRAQGNPLRDCALEHLARVGRSIEATAVLLGVLEDASAPSDARERAARSLAGTAAPDDARTLRALEAAAKLPHVGVRNAAEQTLRTLEAQRGRSP